jgi:hypothetical protein
MKRFILSAMGISVFFVGLGAMMENVSARFKSDEKALEIIRAARTAIGGDSKLREIRALLIVGKTTQTHKMGDVEQTSVGDTEIAIQYPDKMSKMIKIGEGNGGVRSKSVSHEMTMKRKGDEKAVTVTGKNGELKSAENHVFKVRKDDNGEITTEDGKTVFLRSEGIEKVAGGEGETKVFVRKPLEGEKVRTDDGKALDVQAHKVAMEHHDKIRQNDLLQTTLGLLLSAPEGMDVSYTFAGEGEIDGAGANIVNAEFGGQSFKLYIGKSNSLPLAIGYTGYAMPEVVRFQHKIEGPSDGSKDVVMFKRHDDSMAKSAEFLVKFSDFRETGGVQLPYRWTTTVGSKTSDVFDVSTYDINPANISEKFAGQELKLRMKKDGN